MTTAMEELMKRNERRSNRKNSSVKPACPVGKAVCTTALVIAAVSVGFLTTIETGSAQGSTTIRPISDFIDTQGTFCPGGPPCELFVPPVPNFIGFNNGPPFKRCVSVDYAGLANDYLKGLGLDLGTTTIGMIIERRLADGRAEDWCF